MKAPWLGTALVAALVGTALPALAVNSPEASAAVERHRAEQRAAGVARKPGTTMSSKRSADVTARLAACKSDAGFNPIGREKCVWTLCKGHWGRDGCPPGSDFPPKFKFEKPTFEKPTFKRGPAPEPQSH